MTNKLNLRATHAVLTTLVAAAFAVAASGGRAATHRAAVSPPSYVPDEVVVGYSSAPAVTLAREAGIRNAAPAAPSPAPGVDVLRLPAGTSVSDAAARLRALPGVAYAVPNYRAHIAGFIPNDPGPSHVRGGWQNTQWNFLAGAGLNAPRAWTNLIADHRPGGRGVVVAVLDTGVAYRNWAQFKKSPDFTRTQFVDPYDFIANNPFPLDREGHGTFVAGEIAESTNNRIGLTGLAYGATLMPLRVLAADGSGDAATIARGIRYAVRHGAQVINLSLEFEIGIRPSDIPEIMNAIWFAHSRGVVVVGAAGNDATPQIAYPAHAPGAIAVGSTTEDRCVGWYSNTGPGLVLVAPGGGDDAALTNDPDCKPTLTLPPIYQLTFPDPFSPRRFGYPADYFGTSMSSAEVSAAAALVIASRVVGRHPSPRQVLSQLERTAQPLGGTAPNATYGYGLVDAGAATAGP